MTLTLCHEQTTAVTVWGQDGAHRQPQLKLNIQGKMVDIISPHQWQINVSLFWGEVVDTSPGIFNSGQKSHHFANAIIGEGEPSLNQPQNGEKAVLIYMALAPFARSSRGTRTARLFVWVGRSHLLAYFCLVNNVFCFRVLLRNACR